MWAPVATHPPDGEKMTPAWWAAHERLAHHPRVVAIGETGLDYYYDHSPRELQQECFGRFIALARAAGKPVVCHIRDAHDDARRILREHRASELCVIIHCFTGTPGGAAAGRGRGGGGAGGGGGARGGRRGGGGRGGGRARAAGGPGGGRGRGARGGAAARGARGAGR